jgi:hypothetical protein
MGKAILNPGSLFTIDTGFSSVICRPAAQIRQYTKTYSANVAGMVFSVFFPKRKLMKQERNNPQDNLQSQGSGERNQQQSQQREQRNLGQENTNEREDQIGENAGGNFGAGMRSKKDERKEEQESR